MNINKLIAVVTEAASPAKRDAGSPESIHQGGFIALTSVIILSALLIIIGASLGYTSFFSRFNILDSELKQISLGLAEACAEIARVEIANNANFSVPNGGRSYTVGDDGSTCTVISVAGAYTVQAQGIYQNSYSNIEAVYNRTGSDVVVISWKEVP
jgi:hypothetical protein